MAISDKMDTMGFINICEKIIKTLNDYKNSGMTIDKFNETIEQLDGEIDIYNETIEQLDGEIDIYKFLFIKEIDKMISKMNREIDELESLEAHNDMPEDIKKLIELYLF